MVPEKIVRHYPTSIDERLRAAVAESAAGEA
jgi:hypothetical protein